ncbi:hypothetical protein EVAR_56273_1 [Eumeta japonica]|uniref:Uncharacterized protein n=1 Tax=Eumeta variegata TaxID=151549 RepID=A0A4C1YJI4_EUMVA|nr:hypothetical protein EVAR_56273_1 [Eumeta japonica]
MTSEIPAAWLGPQLRTQAEFGRSVKKVTESLFAFTPRSAHVAELTCRVRASRASPRLCPGLNYYSFEIGYCPCTHSLFFFTLPLHRNSNGTLHTVHTKITVFVGYQFTVLQEHRQKRRRMGESGRTVRADMRYVCRPFIVLPQLLTRVEKETANAGILSLALTFSRRKCWTYPPTAACTW